MESVLLRVRLMLCRSKVLIGGNIGSRALVAAHTQISNVNNHKQTIRLWSDAPSRNNKQIRWSNEATNQPMTKPKKKKSPGVRQTGGAQLGRVAMLESGKVNKKGTPKLCTGCGVEMIGSSRGGRDHNTNMKKMAAGEEAYGQYERTKKQEKKSRYADVFDTETRGITPGEQVLCQRCKSLQSGNVFQAYDALKDVDAKVFSSQLEHIVSRRRFGLCVVVVVRTFVNVWYSSSSSFVIQSHSSSFDTIRNKDGTDPEFSSVRKLRDAIKSTPCILAINKVDLLPRMSEYDVKYLKNRVQSGRTRVTDAYAVSATTGEGMVELAEAVLDDIGGKDVFVVGSANVGKSTLVKSLSSLLARSLRFNGKNKKSDDKRRHVLQNLNVTGSHLPGTTLQAVRIPCFPSLKHALWDTPGIINRAALAYSLFPSHLMEPLAMPTKIDIPTIKNEKKVNIQAGYSLLIEADWTNVEHVKDDVDSEDVASDDEDDSLDGEDDWFEESSNINKSISSSSYSSITTVNEEPFTLARLDFVECNGHSVETLAFIPSCLNIRVVKTDNNTPTVATIPQGYIDKVQKLVGQAGNFDNNTTSRSLAIFKGGGGGPNNEQQDGIVKFNIGDVEDYEMRSGWLRRDIVFASLGWIMLSHRRSFSVKPWCVKESLWSKRRALYPSNLKDLDLNDSFEYDGASYDVNMNDDDPAFERIKERLQRANDIGRTSADRIGKAKKRNAREGGAQETYYDDDDVEHW